MLDALSFQYQMLRKVTQTIVQSLHRRSIQHSVSLRDIIYVKIEHIGESKREKTLKPEWESDYPL